MPFIMSLSDAKKSFELRKLKNISSNDQNEIENSWNEYIKSLHNDGLLTGLQIKYAPPFNGEFPPNDDTTFILESTGLTLECSRDNEATNQILLSPPWKTTLKRGNETLVSYMGSILGDTKPTIGQVLFSIMIELNIDDYTFDRFLSIFGIDLEKDKISDKHMESYRRIYDTSNQKTKEFKKLMDGVEMSELKRIISRC